MELNELISQITTENAAAQALAHEHWARCCKPLGSLGALETALSFVDQDAQLLLNALGEPQEKLYEASCSGPGDDGIWIYEDVTVFTYLENGVETVVDAE